MKADFKLSRMTLADRLFEQLRQQILSGRLAAGETLPCEQDIGEAFGVGRTTVREALHGLVSAGFAERHGRTLVVRDQGALDEITLGFAAYNTRSSVQEVYHTRRLIEVDAIRLAAQHRTQADLKAIEEALAAMDTDDPEAYHTADPFFHLAIARASHNEILFQLFQAARPVFFKPPAFWRVFGSRSSEPGGRRIGSGHEGHRVLLEAVRSGDPDNAARLMHEHLTRVETGLLASIKSPMGEEETAPPRGGNSSL